MRCIGRLTVKILPAALTLSIAAIIIRLNNTILNL